MRDVMLIVCQENQIKLSSRTFQLVRELYEDACGVKYVAVWRSLVSAHANSGTPIPQHVY